MQEEYHNDLLAVMIGIDDVVPRPNKIREGIAKLLSSKGYKTKLTSKFDIIIVMTEEEYILLKLKYE